MTTAVAENEDNKPEGTPLPTDSDPTWGDEVRIVEPGDEIEPAEEEEVVEEEEEEADEPELPVVESAPVLQDPGEFKPSDNSFEVTVYDSEGKNGKTVTIKSIDQWEELLDKDAHFGDSKGLFNAQRKATKMETRLDQEKTEHDKKVEAFNASKQAQEQKTQALNSMVSGIDYLVDSGDLPKIPNQYKNADWSDPEVAKHPAVKAQVELLEFWQKENSRRSKYGITPIASAVDAFNAFSISESKKKATETKTTRATARKEAGARVAGSSPAPVSTQPKGISVGRGGSLRDLGGTDWST